MRVPRFYPFQPLYSNSKASKGLDVDFNLHTGGSASNLQVEVLPFGQKEGKWGN